MPKWYDRWMYDWETRLTAVDTNRVVRPLEWGIDWTNAWPCRDGLRPGELPADPEQYLRSYNDRIIANSDDFFSYRTPKDSAWKSARAGLQHARQAEPELEDKSRASERSIFASPRLSPAPIPKTIWRMRAGFQRPASAP